MSALTTLAPIVLTELLKAIGELIQMATERRASAADTAAYLSRVAIDAASWRAELAVLNAQNDSKRK